MERILFRFNKDEAVRYVGHLDLMRVFDRAFRRSGFPIAYSQGFNPRPRMALASALTLGATSGCELCQCDLATDIEPEALEAAFERLRQQLPSGLRVIGWWGIPLEKKNPYIQVKAAGYDLVLTGEQVAERLREFLREGLTRAPTRELVETPEACKLLVTLPVGERDGVRIRDLIAELEQGVPGIRVTHLHRARLWCEQEPAITEVSGSLISPAGLQ